MRLADLHRHLDGSLRPATVADLAKTHGVDVPGDLRFTDDMGLEAALAKFAFTLSLLQTPAAVQRIAREMCEDAEAEHVTSLEIRFAPQLHRGADPEAIVDAALDGIGGRAGLILCGLWGEPPDVLERLVDIAKGRKQVVAIDLAGGPREEHRARASDYERPFRRAAEHGLGRTVHAGEGRPPSEIRVAIELLLAQRIGHGTTLLQDPAVLELVLENNVTIEACPTSNVHVGVIAQVADHPLPKWLERGVRACINTDNTYFSAVTAPEEHANARAIPGMTDALLERAVQHGHAAAFRRS